MENVNAEQLSNLSRLKRLQSQSSMLTETDSQSYGYGGASASAGGPGSLSRSMSAAERSSLESQIELIDSSGDDERVGNSNALVLPLQRETAVDAVVAKTSTEEGDGDGYAAMQHADLVSLRIILVQRRQFRVAPACNCVY